MFIRKREQGKTVRSSLEGNTLLAARQGDKQVGGDPGTQRDKLVYRL